MALATKAIHGVVTKTRAEARGLADLHQLSGVTAFSIIGICLSLMVLTFADRGEWVITFMGVL